MSFRRLSIYAAALFLSATAGALTPSELTSLRSEVLQMCRGGTVTGTRISTRAVASGRVVTLNGVLGQGEVDRIFVSSEQWSGIEALMINSGDYTTCVSSTIAMLAPLIEEKQNIDTNLNARLKYIESPEFCERLVYVISRAPTGFEEWRGVGQTSRGSWRIGSYLMKNADAIGMVSTLNSPLDSATIMPGNDGLLSFYEPLVFTRRFDAQSEAGLLVDKITNSLKECLTFRRFYKVKGIELRGGPDTLKNGTRYWSFDTINRFGVHLKTFYVNLSVIRSESLGDDSDLIVLDVNAP